MRHDQAHETDDAGDGHQRPHQQRHQQDEPCAQTLQLKAQVQRLTFTQQQRIECTPLPQQRPHQRQRPGRQPGENGPVRGGQTAQVPEGQAAQLHVVGQVGEDADERAPKGIDGDAGQQDTCRPRCPSPQQPGSQCGQQTADKGSARQHQRLLVISQNDGTNRADGPAHRDADQARLGQRVAKKRLHDGTSHGQRRPCQHAQQDARQANVQQHAFPEQVFRMASRGRCRYGIGRPAQQGRHRVQRNAHGTTHGRADSCHEQQRQQHQHASQQLGPASSAAVLDRVRYTATGWTHDAPPCLGGLDQQRPG